MRRLVLLSCAASLLSLPAAAPAATVEIDGAAIEYTGTGNEMHNLRISPSGDEIVLQELPTTGGDGVEANMTATAPCVPMDAKLVRCPAAAVSELRVDLDRSGNDGNVVDNQVALPITAKGSNGADRFLGSPFDDRMSGGDGDDELIGEGGRDVLAGGWGNDRLEGGDGDDRLEDGNGDDRVLAGEGDDWLTGDDGRDALRGDGGFDTLDYSARNEASVNLESGEEPHPTDTAGGGDAINGTVEAVIGTPGIDLIHGSNGDNVLDGRGGGDLIFGGGGTDMLIGGEGDDKLGANAGEAMETLLGGPGDDVLSSGPASDLMIGGDGTDAVAFDVGGDVHVNLGDGLMNDGPVGGLSDYVNVNGDHSIEGVRVGNPGRSTIIGDENANLLHGSWDGNHVDGRGGDDVVSGGQKDDVLIGGTGRDRVWAWDGNDTVLARDGEADHIECRGGKDTVFGDPLDLLRPDGTSIKSQCERIAERADLGVMISSVVRVGTKGLVRLAVDCPPPAVTACTGSVKLRAAVPRKKGGKPRWLAAGRRSFAAPAGGDTAITVRVPKRVRTLLASRGRLRARLTVTGGDAYGEGRPARKTVTLKPKR